MRLIYLAILLVLWGCAGNTGHHAAPQGAAAGMQQQPPLHLYRINYQNRGVLVTPDFAAVDRSGEFVLVPTR